MTNLDSILKSRDINLSTKVCLVKAMYGFPGGDIWMWELDYKDSWAQKNWCFWTVVLEKTLESAFDCKEIQPVHPKGNQSWIFIRRTDVEAETPILCPPDSKSWLILKDPDAGKDWGQEEKGMTEDEMVGWHHLLSGDGLGWTPGVGDGQGGLACCSSWGRKELYTTELNWTELLPIICQCVCVRSVTQSCLTLCNLMICSPPGSSVRGIFRKEYWSGLPPSTPGDLPNPGMEPSSLVSLALAGRFFTISTTWDTPLYASGGPQFLRWIFRIYPPFPPHPSWPPRLALLTVNVDTLLLPTTVFLFFFYQSNIQSATHAVKCYYKKDSMTTLICHIGLWISL